MPSTDAASRAILSRRGFLSGLGRGSVALAFAGPAATLLAACGGEEGEGAATATRDAADATGAAAAGTGSTATADAGPRAVVGDVLDFALASDDWPGAFGWVDLRMHRGFVDGEEVWAIRTDASDETYATEHGVVFVPRLRALAGDRARSSAVYVVEGSDDPWVWSTEPGRDDYTPAAEVHRVVRGGDAPLRSLADVEAAREAGEIEVEATGIVVNAPFVVWSSGSLPVDRTLEGYLGDGQLVAGPDLGAGTVRFKLHECFPGSRYIVADTSAPPMAEGMRVASAPALAAATTADATGRVNVLMGGVEGPGPMGGQPSVFDSRAGDPVWSPYWDHLTYVWRDDDAEVLEDEASIHAARDAGRVEEFVGTPDTDGQGFAVNCPVPVVAPNTFEA